MSDLQEKHKAARLVASCAIFGLHGETASSYRPVIKTTKPGKTQNSLVWLRWTRYLRYQHFRCPTKIGYFL